MYVSEPGFFMTSGLCITNRIFFDFLIVTLVIPVSVFNPNLEIAYKTFNIRHPPSHNSNNINTFRAFFSLRDCFPPFGASSASPAPALWLNKFITWYRKVTKVESEGKTSNFNHFSKVLKDSRP